MFVICGYKKILTTVLLAVGKWINSILVVQVQILPIPKCFFFIDCRKVDIDNMRPSLDEVKLSF